MPTEKEIERVLNDTEGLSLWRDREILKEALLECRKELELCEGFLREEKEQNDKAWKKVKELEKELEELRKAIKDIKI